MLGVNHQTCLGGRRLRLLLLFSLIILIQTTNPRIRLSFVFNRCIVCLGMYANQNEILSWFYVVCTLGSVYNHNQQGQEMLMCR